MVGMGGVSFSGSGKKLDSGGYVKSSDHDASKICINDEIIARISKAIVNKEHHKIENDFTNLHYADQELLFEGIKPELQDRLIHTVQDFITPDLILELSYQLRLRFLKVLGYKKFAQILEQLPPESMADVLGDFSRSEQLSLLKYVALGKRKTVRAIMTHPENSAGSIMDAECFVVREEKTVMDALKQVRSEFESKNSRLYDIFVINEGKEIIGTVDIITLIKSPLEATLSSIMRTKFVSLKSTDTTRDVVYVFNKYDLNTVPILDENSEVVGAISIDSVRYIADEQVEGDMLKMSGVLSDLDENIVDTTKIRFIWLFINLVTTALSSWIISFFEGVIHKYTALAVLMPITVSMGSNAGTQTVTVVIRAIATKHLNKNTFRLYFNKEIVISMINSVLFAAICTIGVYFIYKNIALATIFGVAVAITLLISVAAGVFVPLIMKAFGTDPAITSVVFLTAVIDVVAFLSFLGLANWLLV